MKCTVIVPFFNTENYLNECILSVINQSIGFLENIHLILVNDGSTDKSEQIALYFKKKYPKNISYIKINNSGPAAARNKGLELISKDSIFTTFLDADDKLASNAMKKVSLFFERYPKTNIAIIPIYYFEGTDGPIKLNNRFGNNDRVINIHNEYKSPQFYIGGVFIKTQYLIKGKLTFDENINFWEDALFINKAILLDGHYGLVKGTRYWYRKRMQGDSLVDTSWYKKSRYTYLIRYGYSKLISLSKENYGAIIPYVQYLIIYHLKLFTFQKNSRLLLSTLSNDEKNTFIAEVKKILSLIDDKYILEQDTASLHKQFFMMLKNKKWDTFENIQAVNPNNSIKLTKKQIKGVRLVINGYFYDDNYNLKKNDIIFVKTLLRCMNVKEKKINKKIAIWGIVVRDLQDAGFEISLPIWTILFQFGLKTNGEIIWLKKVNIFYVILKRIKHLFANSSLKDESL